MKFVHIADIHFDCPFVNLSDKENMGDFRRLEQRKVFKKVIEYCKENKVDCLFIAGDVYEQEYVKQSTIEYMNQLFKEIPYTRIFIAPGNHDPYLKNSYYYQYAWNENVTIFTSTIQKVELEEAVIYGYGFSDFYCKESGVNSLEIEKNEKANILVIHGSLEGGVDENREYNPLKRKTLEEKEFDYIALGHIHKSNYTKQEKMVYPGSLLALGFDELGHHGIVVGSIGQEGLKTEFIALEENAFLEILLDVSSFHGQEELIEEMNHMNARQDQFVKVILEGNRQFEIHPDSLIKLVSNESILKIKDQTKIAIDLEKMSNKTTLKGLFINQMREKLKETIDEEEKQIIEKAIEIGLEALE